MNLADFREFPERLAVTARILSALFRAQIPASLEAALGDGEFLDAWPLRDAASLAGVAVLRGRISGLHEGIVPDLRANTPMAPHENAETDVGELPWRDDALRLFGALGRPLAEPHESVWLSREHLLFEEQTLQVRACYRRYGLGLVAQGREPDDHIGFELLFLAELLGLLAEAWEDASTDSGEELTELLTHRARLEWVEGGVAVVDCGTILADLRGFYREHFVQFAPQVCQRLEKHASARIFRALPALTRGFMASLEEFLAVMVS